MSDYIPPRRAGPTTTRRRPVDVRTVETVSTFIPAVARDPGLNVPDSAFGGAMGGSLGDGPESPGRTVPELGADVRRADEHWIRLHDATEGARIIRRLSGTLRDSLSTRKTRADFADDAVRGLT